MRQGANRCAGLLVIDLVPGNAFASQDGRRYPIAPVIQRINREFGEFLRQHPETINLPH
jgi:hypothetical protein